MHDDEHETEPVLLDAGVDPTPEHFDHPDDLTETEAAAGLALWQRVDDHDDHSTGLDQPIETSDVDVDSIRLDPHTELDPEHPLVAAGGYALAVARMRMIREVMLDYGVPGVSIEPQVGRPGGVDGWNSLNPVAVFSHHIASTPTPTNPTPGLALVKRGRSDLPGPLANGSAGVDLVYRLLTLGWANHPGFGGPLTVSGPLGAFTIPKDVARPYAWGTEYEGGYSDAVWDREYTHAATGKTMTFREFMGRANAALCEAIWLPGINGHGLYGRIERGTTDLSGYHGEHKTWAPGRKPDRLNYDTARGRAEVRHWAQQATNEEDDVSAQDVWNYEVPVSGGEKGEKRQAAKVLSQAHARAGAAREVARTAVEQTRALRKVVEALVLSTGDEQAKTALAAIPEPPEVPDYDETDAEG